VDCYRRNQPNKHMPIKTQLELTDAARDLGLTLVDEKSDLQVTKAIIGGFDNLQLDEEDFQAFQNEVRNTRNTRINLKARLTFTQQRLDREAAAAKAAAAKTATA
jgi:hypothetical protein